MRLRFWPRPRTSTAPKKLFNKQEKLWKEETKSKTVTKTAEEEKKKWKLRYQAIEEVDCVLVRVEVLVIYP